MSGSSHLHRSAFDRCHTDLSMRSMSKLGSLPTSQPVSCQPSDRRGILAHIIIPISPNQSQDSAVFGNLLGTYGKSRSFCVIALCVLSSCRNTGGPQRCGVRGVRYSLFQVVYIQPLMLGVPFTSCTSRAALPLPFRES